MSVRVWAEADTDHSNKPSAAVCIRYCPSVGAGTMARSRQCSAARSARRRGLEMQPGGWKYDLASRPAIRRLPAPTDTGYTPPDRTAAEEKIQSVTLPSHVLAHLLQVVWLISSWIFYTVYIFISQLNLMEWADSKVWTLSSWLCPVYIIINHLLKKTRVLGLISTLIHILSVCCKRQYFITVNI